MPGGSGVASASDRARSAVTGRARVQQELLDQQGVAVVVLDEQHRQVLWRGGRCLGRGDVPG